MGKAETIMKIITLNLWGGRIQPGLYDFIKKSDADVFCFQEVFSKLPSPEMGKNYINQTDIQPDLFGDIEKLRPDLTGYWCATTTDYYGLAIFAKNNLTIKDSGHCFTYRYINDGVDGVDTQNRCLQWIRIKAENKFILIFNLHGYWNHDGSNHSNKDRQGEIILNKIKEFSSDEVILAGDFNAHPDTTFIKNISQALENLVLKNNITSTRTKYCPYPIRFADYIFINNKVTVKNFTVMTDEVSDHCPLLLEI